ncbi:hypothetical protein ACQKQC_15415 [Vibrio fortis]|uniref:hypothetical protein n=1 Tax=Vibrio fortis TaxID=212667 RepID=UPI004068F0E7
MQYICPTYDQRRGDRVFDTFIILHSFVLTLVVAYISIHFDSHTKESSVLEISQVTILLSTALISYVKAQESRAFSSILKIHALLMLLLVSRELDQVFELFLFHGFWKVPAGAIVATIAYQMFSHRKSVVVAAKRFTTTDSFLDWIIGVFMFLIFSRIAGYKGFWMEFLGDGYNRDIKTLVEEGLEFFGYSFLLSSIILLREKI